MTERKPKLPAQFRDFYEYLQTRDADGLIDHHSFETCAVGEFAEDTGVDLPDFINSLWGGALFKVPPIIGATTYGEMAERFEEHFDVEESV